MSRKSVLLAVLMLLVAFGGAAAGLAALVLHEPGFYVRAEQPPGADRERYSQEFYGEFFAFVEELKERRTWDASFTQEQINSFLAEDFIRSNFHQQLMPEGLSDPRVVFETDKIRLAFRYHVGRWSSVVTIDMRAWLAAADPNLVALELRGMKVGALPISVRSLLEQLSDAAERNNIKVSWYRYNGNPVAVLRFQADQAPAAVVLERLDLHPGRILIRGQSVEPHASPLAGARESDKPS